MLLITCKAGQAEPTLRCGICERPIVSGREGSVVYPGHMPEGTLHRVVLVHTDPCAREAQALYPEDEAPVGRMSLITYLARFVGAEPGDEVPPVPERARARVSTRTGQASN